MEYATLTKRLDLSTWKRWYI